MTPEHLRLKSHHDKHEDWHLFGPYLSDRSWATLREDYNDSPTFWESFTHDQARSRVYRWGEDGIAGISDRHQYLCFSLAFWNGQDPILKERLFGLTNPQGNHGEDVKELYYYLDNTPTHSYMKMLYKYPHVPYPYDNLKEENWQRGLHDPEYELLDTGLLDYGYFDIIIEYAKADPNDISVRITAINRGTSPAPLWILPQLWFRNTWSWGYPSGPHGDIPTKPVMTGDNSDSKFDLITANHPNLPPMHLYCEKSRALLFTENETNLQRLYGKPNLTKHVKDAFHRRVVNQQTSATNPQLTGTKAAPLYQFKTIQPGRQVQVQLRLTPAVDAHPFKFTRQIFTDRIQEADQFYAQLFPTQSIPPAAKTDPEVHQKQLTAQSTILRQSLASLLWTKQFYYYDVQQWLTGDPILPRPTPAAAPQNQNWRHLKNAQIISMPDKWEYPWYANWDLSFHALPFSLVDIDFAKNQLELLLKDRYMHPSGQLPSFENDFDSANPPVTPWATWSIYNYEKSHTGQGDTSFLERTFHKLLLNFSWWINRKDPDGHNLFQGGFLGLDNIGVIDRNTPIAGGHLAQADSTSWMAAYALTMIKMGLELSLTNAVYQDISCKFFDHFLRICDAMTHVGQQKINLWDEEDGFYYDVLHFSSGHSVPLKVRSLVGLLPLIATEIIDADTLQQLPGINQRFHEIASGYPHLTEQGHIASVDLPGQKQDRLLSLLSQDRLRKVLTRLLDEQEFLSPYGIRSLSKYHQDHPYHFTIDGRTHGIGYLPGESDNRMFGGNSNWRGPIWFPLNYILISSLRKFHSYYGDQFKIEFPTGSRGYLNLSQIADQLSLRLLTIFMPDRHHQRPVHLKDPAYAKNPDWHDLILFYEYFHADTGQGLGASHQTGWTALIANLILEIHSHQTTSGV